MGVRRRELFAMLTAPSEGEAERKVADCTWTSGGAADRVGCLILPEVIPKWSSGLSAVGALFTATLGHHQKGAFRLLSVTFILYDVNPPISG